MKLLPSSLLAPAMLVLSSCEETKLYPVKSSAYAAPNSGNITGEDDGTSQASDQPGGSTSPSVTQGAPGTTGVEPAAGPPQTPQPGVAASGGQATANHGGGSTSVPLIGGQGLQQQPPPK